MVKISKKITVNFTNRWLYSFMFLFILAFASVFVFAVAPNPGHDPIQIGPGAFPAGTFTFTKIDVSTIDPIYTIDGEKYATFMAGMVGIKEEVTGVVKTTDGMAVLDFANAEVGSDLWLFGQTINLDGNDYNGNSVTTQEVFDSMIILLSSNSNSDVWYEKDSIGKRIVIHSDSTEVSFRLTAPRFDNSDWSNNADSETETDGLNLDILLS